MCSGISHTSSLCYGRQCTILEDLTSLGITLLVCNMS